MAIEMKVSADQYEQLISRLDQNIAKLSDKIDAYRQKENDLNNFVGEQDSTFEAMRQNVQNNIEAARRAYTTAVNARKGLQEELNKMSESTGMNVQNLEASAETLASTIAAKLPVDELLG